MHGLQALAARGCSPLCMGTSLLILQAWLGQHVLQDSPRSPVSCQSTSPREGATVCWAQMGVKGVGLSQTDVV